MPRRVTTEVLPFLILMEALASSARLESRPWTN
jgi:hypothetical protein